MVSDYTGPMRAGAPAGSPSQYTDPKQIDAVLKSSDPGAVAEAGRSYQKFAQAYEKISGHLLSLRDDLNDAWGGDDAAAAQSQLREVWSAATTVHKTAHAFGSAIETHGSEYLAWYKNNKPPSTSLAEAQSWMTGANERVTQSWSSLPPDLSTTLPPSGRRRYSFGSPSDVSPVGSVGSGGGSSSGTDLGGGNPPESIGDFSGGNDGVGGSGTHLAGSTSFADPSAQGLGLPPGGMGGGTPPPFSPGGGYIPGLGTVPSSGGLIGFGPQSPGALGSPSGGRLPGSTSAAASEAETQAAAAESGAAARAGGTMSPMAGGRDAKERERRRRSWLGEDEDAWTGEVEANPEIIGAIEPAVTEESPAEPAIEIDLSGDGEELATILAELGGDPDPEPDSESDAAPADISARIDDLREQLAKLERQRDAGNGLPPAIEETESNRDWLSGDGI